MSRIVMSQKVCVALRARLSFWSRTTFWAKSLRCYGFVEPLLPDKLLLARGVRDLSPRGLGNLQKETYDAATTIPVYSENMIICPCSKHVPVRPSIHPSHRVFNQLISAPWELQSKSKSKRETWWECRARKLRLNTI